MNAAPDQHAITVARSYERSLTVWLRLRKPEVAALWPGAPVDASWLDWRQRLGPEHVADLDVAFEAVTGPASSRTSRNAGDGPPRAPAERRRP